MLNNFRGIHYREIGIKLGKDDSQTSFNFDFYDNKEVSEERFLSNLIMTGDSFSIVTSDNLDWNPKDIIIIDETRYQVVTIQRARSSISKNIITQAVYKYILGLSA